MRSPRVPLLATSRKPAVSSNRPAGCCPGAKVFQVAPVVEVSATTGEEEVTGIAGSTLTVAEGEASATFLCSLGTGLVSGETGSARRTTTGADLASAKGDFTAFPAFAKLPLLPPTRA